MSKSRKTNPTGKSGEWYDYRLSLWRKVKELSRIKCTVAQISRETGLARQTVKKYMGIEGEAEALAYFRASRARASPKKEELSQHESFFLRELTHEARLSKSQILDHFMENYPDAPIPDKSTLCRYLDLLTEQANIERPAKYSRHFRRCDPEGWGKEAEVDFGECDQYEDEGLPHHVWFIQVGCKASCYKFIYFMDKKFDAIHAVYGLHLAFKYFDGVPERVIFDQDTVFLSDDNFGEFKVTEALRQYAKHAGFEADFCHPYDPQSKGRVERYVRFVKENFLRARLFKDIQTLNEEALKWLRRTGNNKVHDLYGRTPRDMFINDEKPHLKPYTYHMEDPDRLPEARSVNKDNTVKYNGSLYDVPLGTYRGEGTEVIVDALADPAYLLIRDILGNVIVQYKKTEERNTHFKLPQNMELEKMGKSEKDLRERLDQWDDNEPLSRLIKDIKAERKRYAKDVLRELNKIVRKLDLGAAMALVKHCADNHLTLVSAIRTAMDRLQIRERQEGGKDGALDTYDYSDYNPESPSMDDF